jgi:hypothetical protein
MRSGFKPGKSQEGFLSNSSTLTFLRRCSADVQWAAFPLLEVAHLDLHIQECGSSFILGFEEIR